MNSMSSWVVFGLSIFGLLVLDLGVLNRKKETPGVKKALLWTLFWFGIAMLFNVYIYFERGANDSLMFLTGYLVEQSLSMDNVFVFILIFHAFKVEPKKQHKILFWGILGAIVMRGLFVFFGVALIQAFAWVIYIFGALLIWMAIKTVLGDEKEIKPEQTLAAKLITRFVPVAKDYHGDNFFVKAHGKWHVTMLFVALIVVETTDVVFAIDSVPAILSISQDIFIVYTSNIFAVLGLRSLYFVLSALSNQFEYLKHGISAILAFVGTKMLISGVYHIPVIATLCFVFGILAGAILLSLLKNAKKTIR